MATPSHRFGEKLQGLRTQHHMTLLGLAHALGYSTHSYISEIEAGKKLPTAEFVLGVARLFNVSTDQLLKDELELDSSKRTKK
jgi:transcriptional regulator with XRE-family HTH domain